MGKLKGEKSTRRLKRAKWKMKTDSNRHGKRRRTAHRCGR